MSDELDTAAEVIQQGLMTDVPPPTRPRDQSGRFVQTTSSPEPMFGERAMEGSGDAGDDPVRRSREVEVRRGQDDRDDIHGAVDTGPERIGTELDDAPEGELTEEERAAADVPERRKRDDDEEKYEVVIDGHPQDVSLGEALNGYVRQETFHRRLNELSNLRAALEEDHQRQQQNWGLLMQAKEAYEADIRTMMPTEPDWDREFAINPTAAHANQKIWQAMWAKLAQSQRERAWMAQRQQEAEDRRLEKYAVDGFSRFVFDSKIPDKAALEKEINSMRRTALSHGFSEQEVATVYDPRMLAILRKASKYDRMMAAAKPRAEVPGKGRTLTPGSATPLGNAGRRGLDEASRRLASSGKMDDAAEVFRRIL